MYGWMSPKFDSVGCLGAILLFILIVGSAFGLLYMVWTVVRDGGS
jgi:hypothetical protein